MPHTTATILWTSLSEGYYSLLVWFLLLLASFMSWLVDEKKKRSMGLPFWQITWARVTAVSVINPVMMIWFHQAGRIKKTHLFQWAKVVSQRSSALCLPHCGVSHRACQGPLKLSHIGHREDVEAQSVASPQKPLWPWSVEWGRTGSWRATTKTRFTITSAIWNLIQTLWTETIMSKTYWNYCKVFRTKTDILSGFS